VTSNVKDGFFNLVSRGTELLSGKQALLGYFVGEESDFVRFNRAKVRQAMTIRQGHLSLSLIDDSRRDRTTLSLSGDLETDRTTVTRCIREMQAGIARMPADPYLLYSTEPSSAERVDRGALPSREELLSAVLGAADGTDFVGISAAGPISRGFASSFGHRLWHEVDSFQVDWSLYHARDKAVSSTYAASRWEKSAFLSRMDAARTALEHLARPAKTIPPGSYRTYLTPAALAELVTLLNWGGASEKAQRTKTSSLQKLVEGQAVLSPKFTLSERTKDGLSPAFDQVGFRKPDEVALVRAGRHAGALIGPRSAREYGAAANADAEETFASADVAAGGLPNSDVLTALGTGIYVGNLWYLNFSDRANGRVTGMTRFATFWVEDGKIVAPLNVMRFDDSLYRMLGEHLLDFTVERDVIQSSSTYSNRSVETTRLPGALIKEVSFTL
jgi:predicted Zn-dependent protease